MSYREMAIDAGAQGEDEIRQMAQMIEEDHRRLAEEDAYARALEEEMMRRAYEEDDEIVRSPSRIANNFKTTTKRSPPPN